MKKFFVSLVVLLVVVSFSVSAFAANRNYSDWFDLDRINAVDVEEDLREEASREEVALLISELCERLELLPASRTLEFEDERDFSSTAAYKMITRLSSTGIVCGYPDEEFKPENYITRAEALAMILRTVDYFGLKTENYRRGNAFTDTQGHWAEVYCSRAYEQGLVSGRGNGRFYPNDDITREEVITILVNLMGESNNPLIFAIDTIFDLKFDNFMYKDTGSNYYDDRYYDDRYKEKDYEEAIKRPVVNTGTTVDNSVNNSVNNTSTERPVRPTVELPTSTTSTTITTTTTANGEKPSRPVVDTTTSSSTSSTTVERPVVNTTTSNSTASTIVERPSVDTGSNETASSRPTRPTV